MVNDSIELLNSRLPVCVKKIYNNYGSLISIECGELPLPNKDVTFSIFVYLCDWKIYQGTKILLTSSFRSEEKSKRILAYLKDVGGKITSIEFCEPKQTITIKFEKQIMIELYPNLKYYSEEDDLVTFFMQGERALSYSPKEKFYFEVDGKICEIEQID